MVLRRISILMALSIFALPVINSCRKDLPAVDLEKSGYPDAIGKIILGKCAVSGCHNSISSEGAGGLNLESWESLFRGGRGGAVVIPYRTDFSTLAFYINTHEDLGLTLSPTMPVGAPPLSREEVITVFNWISNGAPDRKGFVKFSDNPARPRFFISNQGCDEVAVFDQETNLCMRYFKVGNFNNIESPHMIKLSPDGYFFYVIFNVGFGNQNFLQKFSVQTGQLISQVNLGAGSWNTFDISADGKRAYVVDWNANGGLVDVNLVTMSVVANYQGMLIEPHGNVVRGSTLYIGMQNGNGIFKMDTSDISNYSQISLAPPAFPDPGSSTLKIHEIAFAPDGSKYFVTCQSTANSGVRIVKTTNDSVMGIIPLSGLPSEMAISPSRNFLVVICTEEITSFPGKRGSVAVINYNTMQLIKKIYTGHQPHGIALNDVTGVCYVANRNQTTGGPAPHHASECGGRNGYLTIINLNTLDPVPGFKTELSVDPYSIAAGN